MIKLRRLLVELIAIAMLPFLVIAALLARFARKPFQVGLGPEPLINNLYHKQALRLYGYAAETFVGQVYFITQDFDIKKFGVLRYIELFLMAIRRYSCIYIYFHGGPLGVWSRSLRGLEPHLFHLAGVKIVVMPYGTDVQEMTRSRNLSFKHAQGLDYPGHRLRRRDIAYRIDLWPRHADHIISGCEWVDYMLHWDTLMLGHFSIDTERWAPPENRAPRAPDQPLRVLHAPNHRAIKGSQFFIEAIAELQTEGVPIELVLLEKVPNEKVRETMADVDIVADQLIIGWYAMFALEAMAMQKPILCYLRPDLEELYLNAGLIQPGEIPILRCTPQNVKEVLRSLAQQPAPIDEIGRLSRKFVLKHHSLQAVGREFDRINRSIGIKPGAG